MSRQRRSFKKKEITVEIRPRALPRKDESTPAESSASPEDAPPAPKKVKRGLWPSFTSPFRPLEKDEKKEWGKSAPPPEPDRKFEARRELGPSRTSAPEEGCDQEDGSTPPEKSDSRKAKRLEPAQFRERLAALLRQLRRQRLRLIPALGSFLLVLVIACWISHASGVSAGMRQAKEVIAPPPPDLPPETWASLDKALVELRSGRADVALQRLNEIDRDHPDIPSIHYLLALAAMQNGEIALSESQVQASIRRKERVSDALALQAVLEGQKSLNPSSPLMGDPRLRAETWLRQAIQADPANPYPHFELAMQLRNRGLQAEARQEFHAAEVRFNPVDSHLVLAIIQALMNLEETPDDKIPRDLPVSDDVGKLFPAAYAAMRQGDFPAAAVLLEKARKSASPDLYAFLKSDPAFRKFIDQPQLRPLLQD